MHMAQRRMYSLLLERRFRSESRGVSRVLGDARAVKKSLTKKDLIKWV